MSLASVVELVEPCRGFCLPCRGFESSRAEVLWGSRAEVSAYRAEVCASRAEVSACRAEVCACRAEVLYFSATVVDPRWALRTETCPHLAYMISLTVVTPSKAYDSPMLNIGCVTGSHR